MLVDAVEAVQEISEAVGADRDHDRETDRRIDGVSPADPIPEAKGVRRIDAEGFDLVESGGDCNEVLRDGFRLLLLGAVDGTGLLERLELPSLG